MPAKATPADLNNAISDYLAGEGCQAVAARHHIGQGRLKCELTERGLWRTAAEANAMRAARTSRGILSKSDLPTAEIARRYSNGESSNALAQAFGVSRTAIDYRLRSAGVHLRTNPDANRLMAASRTPDENRLLMLAAQASVRGSKRTHESLCRAAASREVSPSWVAAHTSEEERQMCRWIEARGLVVTPQKAIGPYNVDLATGAVAVEIFGGGWHQYGSHRMRTAKRLGYILDQGWHLMIIWAINARWPIDTLAADEIVAFAKSARRDPSGRGQHRVIWGDGKSAAAVGPDLDDLAVIPSRSGRNSPRAGHKRAGDQAVLVS